MEDATKKGRRGRPKAFSEQELRDAEGRDALTHRQRQNRAYAHRARLRLAELLWWEDLSEGQFVPQCVLAELGRIEDDVGFGEAAWWYACSPRDLTAKQAAAKLKEMRIGAAPAESLILYKRLMRTIKDFRILHPEVSFLSVEGEVRFTLETVRRLRQ